MEESTKRWVILMSRNDDRILTLRKQIEEKEKNLKQIKVKFSPETNCVLELDGVKHNINVCKEDELKLLLIKLNSYLMSAKDLKMEDMKISGYTIDLWISDIQQKLLDFTLKEEEKKLKSNKELLERLLSEDKKTELMLDEIAASLM